MSKRTWLLLLSLFCVLTASVSGTLAYLVSDDSTVNVMTVGRVDIAQNEQKRSDSGALVPFTQNKPLLPAVYSGSEIPLSDHEADWPNKNAAWQTLQANEAVVDKFVTVTNEGNEPAYVRTIVALESPAEGGSLIHVNHNTADTLPDHIQAVDRVQNVVVGGVTFDVYIYTYKNPLAKDETTIPSLKQLYMDKACTKEDLTAMGDTYDVLVLSQAVQVTSLEDAKVALNSGFGEPTAANLADWLTAVSSGTTGGNEGGSGDNTDDTTGGNPPAGDRQPIAVSNMTELNAALADVPSGESVVLQLAPGNYSDIQNATGKTITLQGGKDVVLQMATDNDENGASDDAFESSALRLEGITVEAATAGNHQGFACASLDMVDCDITGHMTLFAPASFTGCDFSWKGVSYSITTNGQNVSFTDCSFGTYDRAVYVTNPGTADCTIRADGCTMNDITGGNQSYSAFEVESSKNGNRYTLILNNCTVTGVKPDSGNCLWSNPNNLSNNLLSVTVDGTQVH